MADEDYSKYGASFEPADTQEKSSSEANPYEKYGASFEPSSVQDIEQQITDQQNAVPEKQNFFERHPFIADIPKAYLGLGEGLNNMPLHIANALLGRPSNYGMKPGIDYQQLGLGKSTPIDEEVINALKYAPFAAGAPEALGAKGLLQNIFAQGVGGGAYGLSQGQNPFESAAQNMTLGAGTEGLFGGVGKALSSNPDAHAAQFIDSISNGKNLEQNGQNIANKMRGMYNWLTKDPNNPSNFKRQYNALLSGHAPADVSVVQPVSLITGTADKGELGRLKLTKEDFGGDAKTWNKYLELKQNPTLQNYHEFQSHVGKQANKINSAFNDSRKENLENYYAAQNAARNDLHGALDRINPNLTQEYKSIGQRYKTEAAPYLANPTLRNIVHGFNENPTQAQLKKIFRNPPTTSDVGINKIISHQSPEFKNQILHSALGISPENITADKLLGASNRLDAQGLGSYLTPEHRTYINQIPHLQNKQNLVKRGIGGLSGIALSHFLKSPELLGAFLGASAGPNAFHVLKNTRVANNPLTNLLKEATKKTVNPLVRGALVTQEPKAYNKTKEYLNYLNSTR